jgi:hypothetical protein
MSGLTPLWWSAASAAAAAAAGNLGGAHLQ